MAVLKILGSVQEVLEGRVKTMHNVAKAHYRYALGGGSFTTIEQIGDSIILDGVQHVVFEEKDTLHLVSGTNGSTPFLMGLDTDQHSVPSVLKKKRSPSKLFTQIWPNNIQMGWPWRPTPTR